MKKNYKFYSEKLVQRVNELYSDFTSEEYHYSHPEIFEQTKERWKRIAKHFFNFDNPITIVDIGTGTGFIPLTIARFLKKEDIFICSDISGGMLDVTKRNINRENFHCQVKFVKIKNQVPLQLPFETRSINVIVMSAVLHHIKDTNTFLDEVDRILKTNGLLFVGHEPNRYFYEHKFLWYNYLIINHLINPQHTIYEIFKKLHLDGIFEKTRLKKIIKKIYYFMYTKKKETVLKHKKITNKINEVLLKERLIEEPLLPEEICWEITDIKLREGFKPDLLLPHYKLLHLETYNHIFWVSVRRHGDFIIRKYDNLLKRKYPKDGAAFFVVLKKYR